MMRHFVASLFLFLACAAHSAPDRPDPIPLDGFPLRDFLGRSWRNEVVSFPLTAPQLQHAKSNHALVGPEGKPVPYQLVPGASPKEARIEFLADLNPFETRIYRFTNTPAKAATDLKIEETAESVRICNDVTGIAVAKTLKGGRGVIEGVRLNSGKWVCGSRLTSEQPPATCMTEITARGPVFAEVVCRISWEDQSKWELRCRVIAGEPVVLIDETCNVQGDKTSFVLSLSPEFAPDTLFYRLGKANTQGPIGRLTTWKQANDGASAFFLEPWLHWHVVERRGNWVGLYNEQGNDLFALGALQPGLWVDPAKVAAGTQMPASVIVAQEGQGLQATFPVQSGRRKWMVATLDKDLCLEPLKGKDGNEPNLYQAPLPQQYLIKHGDFPLNMVKDYVSTWKGDHDNYPRLFITRKDLPKFRQSFKTDPNELAQHTKSPVSMYTPEGPISYYLGTGDTDLGKHLTETAVQWVQDAVNMYVKQDALVTLGFAPHHQTQVLTAMNLADVALSTGLLSPEQRERLLAQVAFLGYTVNRADYWSPERGFAANPNMTTTVNAYKAAVGCLIPSHPMAKSWVKSAMEELKSEELDHWSDENGGWLEAPHYAMVSFDYIVGCFIMARNAGFNDYLYDPRMKKVAEWFGKISTPPDSRSNGYRHRPPIGNSYLYEPTSMFGLIAYLWKDKDPEFAAQMQWMHRQQGSYPQPGIGGFFPTLAGYRSVMLDPDIPEKPPTWKSELFPETGVVLRNAFPSERESQLHLIAGNNHAHYDNDSGSITVWGKGRIIADDFGYYGYAPADDHNLVESPVAGNGIMQVKEFKSSDNLDYILGVKEGWKRQIAFVKDKDPLAPNYFVVCDSFKAPAPATWRLWLTARKVTPGPQAALVEGKEDVDTDIFFTLPQKIELTTEERTRTSASGLYPDKTWKAMPSTQTGLIANLQRERVITAVIYPRLKSEKPPVFTSIAEGKGVKVQSPAGTDYVLMSPTPFYFNEGEVSFEGTVGVVQLRGGAEPVLSLGAPGSISARGQTVKEGAIARVADSALAGGDFESGSQDLFPAAMSNYGSASKIYKGNPAPGDTEHKGAYCLAVTCDKASGFIGLQRPIYIDPTKTYRYSYKVYMTRETVAQMGGYAPNGAGGNLPNPDGTGTWEYSLWLKGPTEGWKTLETTIGPAGSGAKFTWPEAAFSVGMGLWLSGGPGTVYVDDLVVEETSPESKRGGG